MNIFVSSGSVDDLEPTALIEELRSVGHHVLHSPGATDFGDWYERGLCAAVAACEVGIIIVNDWWDSSTWMAIEANELHRGLVARSIRALFIFNPGHVKISALGMQRYVANVPEIDLADCATMLHALEQPSAG